MIEFNDLDTGYEQCIGIYNTVTTTGESITSRLSQTIDALTIHWLGEDATKHVNSLVKVHSEIASFIKATVEVMADTTEKVVQVQEARESNGATNASVGTTVARDIEIPAKAEIPGTIKYFCDQEARQDHENLVQLIDDFKTFSENVERDSDELMSNWISGNGRQKAQEQFDGFKNASNGYYQVMVETASALDKAVSNLEQLMTNN